MIGRSSRYAATVLFTDGSSEFLSARPPIDIRPRPDDRFHTAVDGDRLDALALRFLGRPELWWVIADYNELTWPLDVEVGSVLRIPSTDTLQMRLIP